MLHPLQDAAIRKAKRQPVRYQRALTTITPAVGRRIGSTDGTNAVYIPSGDVVSFGRGNQVTGNFYQRWDGSQLTLAMKITMDRPSTYYTGTVYALYGDANWSLAYNGATGNWVWTAGGRAVTVASAGWVQGAALVFAVSVDTKRVIDATNYARLSINDVATFGAATQPTASVPATIYLGSNNGATALSGIYEGATFMRRVLFDGTYGVQPSDGDYAADELAAIYNAGNFRDPAKVVPAEDIVYQLAPKASSGALTTTDEGWSFPHSSDLGDDAQLSQGFYGGAANAVGLTGATQNVQMANTTPYNSLAGDMTAEGWFRPRSTVTGFFFRKAPPSFLSGWGVQTSGTYTLAIRAVDSVAGLLTSSTYALAASERDVWIHLVVEFDLSSLTLTGYVNGVARMTLVLPNGAVSDAAAGVQLVGMTGFTSSFGWMRISDTLRYAGAFTPPRACPADDANTLCLWAMNEGTGATVNDLSASNNDGTITGGTWVQPWEYEGTPSAVAVTAAANQVYGGGLSFTSDAANEGIKQTIPVAAGADLLVTAWMHSDANGQPALVLYDADNSAEIARLETAAPGDYDDVDGPWRAELTCEAPTGCTHVEVRCINLAATGTVYVHQVLALPNLISNPSFERAGAAPPVAADWVDTIGSGAIADEAALMRSGAHAIKLTRGAADDTLVGQNETGTASRRYRLGLFMRGDGTNAPRYSLYDAGSASLLVPLTTLAITAAWQRTAQVFMAPSTVAAMTTRLYPGNANGAIGYGDDVSLLLMDTVALTVTPAAASSLINGADTAVRTLSGQLGATAGDVPVYVTPTWSAANAVKNGSSPPKVLVIYYGLNDYIMAYLTANTLWFKVRLGGVNVFEAGTNVTATWLAGVEAHLRIRYWPGGAQLLLNGVAIQSYAGAVAFPGIPTSIRYGNDVSGVQQGDMAFR